MNQLASDGVTAADLVVASIPVITSDIRVSEVADFFHIHNETDFLPVIEKDHIMGIVWRRELMDLFAGRYGRDLYHRKRIRHVMDKNPIVVDANMPIVSLSHLITEYHGGTRGDAFLITKEGRYFGASTFVSLLRKMTILQVQSARYANPLSGLPGNVPIQQQLSRMLTSEQVFSLVYVDLDHFKAYNDYYSFEQGDRVIRMLSAILQSHANEDVHFIGHIGGDDFLIILKDAESYVDYCTRILNDFRHEVLSLYSEEDRARHGICAKNRQGEMTFFPVMSLSLGVLVIYSEYIAHTEQLASLATTAKKKAKESGGNTFVVLETVPSELVS